MTKRCKTGDALYLYQSPLRRNDVLEKLQNALGHCSSNSSQHYIRMASTFGEGRSPSTLEREVRYLLAFFGWLQMLTNPCRHGEMLVIRDVAGFGTELKRKSAHGLLRQTHDLSRTEALQAHLSSLDSQLRESER
jgi:hypothetical protein